jgi:hypothetical protein
LHPTHHARERFTAASGLYASRKAREQAVRRIRRYDDGMPRSGFNTDISFEA